MTHWHAHSVTDTHPLELIDALTHSMTDTLTDWCIHWLTGCISLSQSLTITIANCSSLSYPTGEPELQTLKGVWDPLISADLSALLFASSKGGLANQDGCLGAVVELINQLQGPYAILHTGKQSSHSISLYLSLSLSLSSLLPITSTPSFSLHHRLSGAQKSHH